jgi:hypothetical protein
MVPLVNKRLFPRVRIKGPISYQIRGTHDIDHIQTDDISIGGVGFSSEKFIPPATAINLEISVASRTLRPIGKVTRSMPSSHSDRFRTGVTFLEMEPDEKKYLSDFITMRLNHD